MKRTILIISLAVLTLFVQGQNSDTTLLHLNQLGKEILSRKPDSSRLIAQAAFKQELHAVLTSHIDTIISLDTLKNLSVKYTQDSSLRIITWIFPYDNEAFTFHGFIHYFNPVKGQWNIVALNDQHKAINDAPQQTLSADKWYGALYYDLIENKNVITLLGWNGYHSQKNEKIIEILTFDEQGEPVFGKEIFPGYHSGYYDHVKRVIFQYANEVTMSLRYSNILHEVEQKDELNPYRINRVKKRDNMIIFNKLEPIQPMFEGEYKYYVPLSEQLDGFLYQDEQWIFREKVDVLSEDAPMITEKQPARNLFSNEQ